MLVVEEPAAVVLLEEEKALLWLLWLWWLSLLGFRTKNPQTDYAQYGGLAIKMVGDAIRGASSE
jgi:hypothetical protein